MVVDLDVSEMSILCIIMTIVDELKHAGVIEGGTGTMTKQVEHL